MYGCRRQRSTNVKYVKLICIVLCYRLLSNSKEKKSRKRVKLSKELMQYPNNLLQYTVNVLVVARLSVKNIVNKWL